MMTPKKILLFFIGVLAGLFLLMLIFPKNGIKITDDFTLQFVTINEFFNPVKNTDISDILANNEVVNEDTIVEFVEPDIYDTAYIDSVAIVYKPVQISIDSTLQPIEFPENADTLPFDFYKTLGSLNEGGGKIHVLHYGDSQIEVDRMTSYFRYKLQSTYGGYGCGFHSGIQAFDFKQPMIVTYSDNWHRYSLFPHKDSLIQHRRFGITTMFSMFKAVNDTLNDTVTAWIQFDYSPIAFSNVRKFKQLKIFYGHNSLPVNISVYDAETLVFSDILPASENLQIKTFTFENIPHSVKIEYTGASSPEIYGYSFESLSGVMVDNLPVRGSAGLFFGRFDFSLTSQMYAAMNVRLILLQFGGNAVGRDSANIKAYVNYFGKQMDYLHTMAPNAQIIVIGPADMSEKHKNDYVTRENLPYLIGLIKQEAFLHNCAFWNMYEAMGGENSMPSWVFHDPPLAEKDFIHFTPKGADIIAKMFYKALVADYNKFVTR